MGEKYSVVTNFFKGVKMKKKKVSYIEKKSWHKKLL